MVFYWRWQYDKLFIALNCRTASARQTPPTPIIPRWAQLPRDKVISGMPSTIDPVGKPQLSNKISNQLRLFTKIRVLFIGNLMYSVIHKPFRDVKNLCYFLSKKIQILNKRSRLWTKEDKLVKLHTGHKFIRYRIKIYSLPLMRVSG